MGRFREAVLELLAERTRIDRVRKARHGSGAKKYTIEGSCFDFFPLLDQKLTELFHRLELNRKYYLNYQCTEFRLVLILLPNDQLSHETMIEVARKNSYKYVNPPPPLIEVVQQASPLQILLHLLFE